MSRTALFLDRDGVINRSPPSGEYVERWEAFEFLPSIFDWVRLANASGQLVIVVTNQRGIALGRMTEEDLKNIHTCMIAEFEKQGCRIDGVYYCPHAIGECDCRKPKPGMILQAQQEWDIDLSRSVLVGDSESDRQLADGCGIKFLLANNGQLLMDQLS